MRERLGIRWLTALGLLAVASSTATPARAADFDAAAARKMARANSCLRCHAVEKKKEGPSYHAIAYKYKGQDGALQQLVKHITSGEKVRLSDGHEEDHKITKSRDDAEIRNLVAWILAQ